MNSRSTKSAGEPENPAPDDRTDFQALETGVLNAPRPKRSVPTDFASLRDSVDVGIARGSRRDAVDWVVDVFTPLMIFVMVYSIVFFLLDVRYIYTEVHNANIRVVAFFFLMGVIALNRMIVREDKDTSYLWGVALALCIGLYTCATTGTYEVGSVARNFMNDNAYLATVFNLCIVAFLWWVTNRLTHECCVDEKRMAGDIGILTGTARRFREAIRPAPAGPRAKRKKQPVIEMMELDAVDPTESPQAARRGTHKAPDAAKPLPKRHPGISIFYFSVPVLIIFSLGLRVIQHGGDRMVLAGHFYVGLYSVAALSLLLFTSLGGVREHFRARHTPVPKGLGVFWIGLGAVMIAMVLVAAMTLPLPGLPEIAHIDRHETDFWTRHSTFELITVPATAGELVRQNRFIEFVGKVVLVSFGLFLAYGALRALGALAAAVGKQRRWFPRWVVRLFEYLERLLDRMLCLPALPKFKRRRRVRPEIAISARYKNPFIDPTFSERPTADLIEYAYQALCALAHDLGVPRREHETPYEFLQAFPEELGALRQEARELTDLYVRSAYSTQQFDERIHDRLRNFWTVFNRVRSRVVR